ncbi:MAG TPA: glycosyltransferase family 2 protein [Gaiellaceae bacterium]
MTTCSVVVPVHNRAALTRQCLDTLLASPPATVEVELLVVDDGSTDDTVETLESYGDRVRTVRHSRNTCFAVSCNDGAAAATGEWLVLLNNDTLPQAGWLDALLEYAAERDRIGMVGAKLLFPNDTIQHAGVVFSRDRHPHHLYAGFPASHPAVNRSRAFQVVTAACALIRRELFEECGGFDSAFLNGYEDVDLCLRLRSLGYENHYCHESVLYHLESATRDYALDPRNFRLFFDRWADRIEPDDFDYYLEDGLIEISYWEQFPALLRVSPQLAVLSRERRTATEKLLAERSHDLFEAQKEIIRLNLQRTLGPEPEAQVDP